MSDIEIASRLSFFLWSSIPDERLIDLAERGQLTRPEILEQQVRRMLADRRAADALVNDFAAQWLNLRRVDEVVVHPDLYPEFRRQPARSLQDGNRTLRRQHAAGRSQRARSAPRRLHVRQRAAGPPLRHSGHLRQPFPPRHAAESQSARRTARPRGAAGHDVVPDRTSPVLRGKWLLDNIFGVAVPPPPPGVDTTLPETKPGSAPPTIRERLAQHRRDPVCSSCHSVIDPPGFALENFDAIGGWRTVDEVGQAGGCDRQHGERRRRSRG